MSGLLLSDQAPSLLASLRYIFELEMAQWARRNRVEPPWWLTTWIGAVLSVPMVVGACSLALGGGVLVADGMTMLPNSSATGDGLVIAAAVVLALSGVIRSGRASVVAAILQPANRAHLIASNLHPWTLLTWQILLELSPVLLRTMLFFWLMMGCELSSDSVPFISWAMLVVLCLTELMASLVAIIANLHRHRVGHPALKRLALREFIVVMSIFFATYSLCAHASEILIGVPVDDAWVLRMIVLLDELGRSAPPIVIALCLAIMMASTPVVVRALKGYQTHESPPGSLCHIRTGPVERSARSPRWGILSAVLAASLTDPRRASVVWRKHALFSIRIGVFFVAAVIALSPHLPSVVDAWSRAALSGTVLTLELALLISLLSAQGTSLWHGPIRWLIDLGQGALRATAGYLGGIFLCSVIPMLPLALGAALISDEDRYPFRLACAIGVVFAGAMLGDLLDGAASVNADDTAEAGVVGGLVSGIILAASTSLLTLHSQKSTFLLLAALVLALGSVWLMITRQLTHRRPSR